MGSMNESLGLFTEGIKKLLLPLTGLYLANKVLGAVFTENARKIAFAREEFYALSIAAERVGIQALTAYADALAPIAEGITGLIGDLNDLFNTDGEGSWIDWLLRQGAKPATNAINALRAAIALLQGDWTTAATHLENTIIFAWIPDAVSSLGNVISKVKDFIDVLANLKTNPPSINPVKWFLFVFDIGDWFSKALMKFDGFLNYVKGLATPPPDAQPSLWQRWVLRVFDWLEAGKKSFISFIDYVKGLVTPPPKAERPVWLQWLLNIIDWLNAAKAAVVKTIKDIAAGEIKPPFISDAAWQAVIDKVRAYYNTLISIYNSYANFRNDIVPGPNLPIIPKFGPQVPLDKSIPNPPPVVTRQPRPLPPGEQLARQGAPGWDAPITVVIPPNDNSKRGRYIDVRTTPRPGGRELISTPTHPLPGGRN